MRDGYEICLEIGREADAKYPDDSERALEFARVQAKRKFSIASDTHPWVIEQLMPTLKHTIQLARANANRQIARERQIVPSKTPASVVLNTLPAERPKARQPERKLSSVAAEVVGGMAYRIWGTQLGLLRGGELPSLIEKGKSTAVGVLVPTFVLKKILDSGRVPIDKPICEVLTVAEVDGYFAEARRTLDHEAQKLIA